MDYVPHPMEPLAAELTLAGSLWHCWKR